MDVFLAAVASFIERVAEMGAGFLSGGLAFQPDIPEELLKKLV